MAPATILAGATFGAPRYDPYRHAEAESALDELRRCAGTQFDPLVVAVLDAVIMSEIAPAGANQGQPRPTAPSFADDEPLVRQSLTGQLA